MTGKTFQMIGVAQRSHELSGQAFPTLSAYLPTALGFRGDLVLFPGVRRRSGRVVCAIVGRERVRRRGGFVCGTPRQAVVARVVGRVLLLGALLFHGWRSLRRCAHIQLRQF
jgi:hypothetical protein